MIDADELSAAVSERFQRQGSDLMSVVLVRRMTAPAARSLSLTRWGDDDVCGGQWQTVSIDLKAYYVAFPFSPDALVEGLAERVAQEVRQLADQEVLEALQKCRRFHRGAVCYVYALPLGCYVTQSPDGTPLAVVDIFHGAEVIDPAVLKDTSDRVPTEGGE